MFTQRAFLLGFVAFCLYLVVTVNTVPTFYYVLTWLAVGLLGASLGIALLSLVGMEAGWKIVRPRGFARWQETSSTSAPVSVVPPLVELSLLNRGSFNKTGIMVEIRATHQNSETIHTLPFLIEALPAGRAATMEVPLDGLPRGLYHLTEARIIGSDVLGLFRFSRRLKFDEPMEIVVAPPLIETPRREHLSAGRTLRGSKRARRQHQGDELRSLRPYAPGDDVRHIHWKSSARLNDLVVREWEQPGRASVLIIWDGEAEAKENTPYLPTTEIGLSLCGSLATLLLKAGSPTTLLCAGTRVESATDTTSEENSPLPTRFQDMLARAQAGRQQTLGEALSVARQTREFPVHSDSIIVVSALQSPNLVQSLPSLANRERNVTAILLDNQAFKRLTPTKGRTKSASVNDENRTEGLASQLLETGIETHIVAPQEGQNLYNELELLLARIESHR